MPAFSPDAPSRPAALAACRARARHAPPWPPPKGSVAAGGGPSLLPIGPSPAGVAAALPASYPQGGRASPPPPLAAALIAAVMPAIGMGSKSGGRGTSMARPVRPLAPMASNARNGAKFPPGLGKAGGATPGARGGLCGRIPGVGGAPGCRPDFREPPSARGGRGMRGAGRPAVGLQPRQHPGDRHAATARRPPPAFMSLCKAARDGRVHVQASGGIRACAGPASTGHGKDQGGPERARSGPILGDLAALSQPAAGRPLTAHVRTTAPEAGGGKPWMGTACEKPGWASRLPCRGPPPQPPTAAPGGARRHAKPGRTPLPLPLPPGRHCTGMPLASTSRHRAALRHALPVIEYPS